VLINFFYFYYFPPSIYFLESHAQICSLRNAIYIYIQTMPFAKFMDWRQCAAVMQREAVAVTPSCSGGVNVVVA
jgi:hypothetical protein